MNIHRTKIQRSLFAAVLIAALLIGFAGMQHVQAQTPTSQTLQVANWSTPVTLTYVTGRPTVIYDGTAYHMWYTVTEGGDLHYTSFTDPANVPAGTAVTGLVAGHQSSPAVVKEGDTFYMVNYTDTTDKSFSLFTSTDGAAWTQGDVIFAGVGLPADFQKIDAPSLIQDTGDYKLYFQVRAADNTYSLYAATSATLNGTYTLANGDNPILTPGASGAWDTYRLQHPMVVKDGENYYLWYVGYPNGGTQHLGFAFSSDGITWTKGAGSPILSGRAAEPSILKAGDTWHLWYLAESAAIKYIAASGPFQFSTIQAAVDAASEGDTISIAPGTYAETILNGDRVAKTSGKQLNFVGSVDAIGDPTTTIQGSLSINLPGNDNNWRIENIDFVPVTDSPSVALLDLWNVNGATIANCTFDGGAHYLDNPIIGISFPAGSSNGNSNITVEDSYFGNGIFAAVQGYITHLTFRNSTVEDATSGINLQGGSNLVVEDSSVSVIAKSETNSAFGIRFASAVAAGTTNNLTVTGSTFSVNKNGLVANSGTFYSTIIIRTGAGGTLTAAGNNILGEVVNQSTTPFNAMGNWWGSADGPADGQITGDVLYCDWLDAAAPDGTPTGSSLVTNMTSGATYCTIQAAVDAATAGDTINVAHGEYIEIAQIVIDKNLSIVGANQANTIIKPAQDTSASGDARGWILVNSGVTFNLSNVTLDGTGHNIYQGIRDFGSGTFENIHFTNIKYPTYLGTALVAMGGSGSQVNITNSSFDQIGRLGVQYFGTGTRGTFDGNLYVGKGHGNWLDYGVEVGGGANANINNSTFSECTGVAASDGSTSAGVLVTTYYGPGSAADIQGNIFEGNSTGISVGYDDTDTSTVNATINKFTGDGYGISSTAPTVDATNNWWGSAIPGDFVGKIEGDVAYNPYLCNGTDTEPEVAGFQPDLTAQKCTSEPTKLVFTQQPALAFSNVAFGEQPVVEAQDADGNLGMGFAGEVQLTIGANPSEGTLNGTTTVSAINGVATFSDLTIDKAGIGYTLLADSTSLTQATSSPFDVIASILKIFLPLIFNAG